MTWMDGNMTQTENKPAFWAVTLIPENSHRNQTQTLGQRREDRHRTETRLTKLKNVRSQSKCIEATFWWVNGKICQDNCHYFSNPELKFSLISEAHFEWNVSI